MTLRRVALSPARQLKFAPEWPCSDARVVFDALSGDYWVLSQLATDILSYLHLNGILALGQLQQYSVESFSDHFSQETFDATLQSLTKAGLLVDTAALD